MQDLFGRAKKCNLVLFHCKAGLAATREPPQPVNATGLLATLLAYSFVRVILSVTTMNTRLLRIDDIEMRIDRRFNLPV